MLTYNKQNRLFLTSLIILLSAPILNSCSKLEQKTYEALRKNPNISNSSNVIHLLKNVVEIGNIIALHGK